MMAALVAAPIVMREVWSSNALPVADVSCALTQAVQPSPRIAMWRGDRDVARQCGRDEDGTSLPWSICLTSGGGGGGRSMLAWAFMKSGSTE